MSAPGPSVRRECRCPRARHQHGTKSAYNSDRCRCQPCRDAVAVHNRGYYRRRAECRWAGRTLTVDGVGTRRRLRALTALGWTTTELGERLGVSPQAVHDMRHREKPVRLTTAQGIAALYDALSMTRPTPGRWVNARAARTAAARGWLPPLAYDDADLDSSEYTHGLNIEAKSTPDLIDEIAVERAMRGDRVALTKAERSEAFARLDGMGTLSAQEIGELLGVTGRTVARKRASERAA